MATATASARAGPARPRSRHSATSLNQSELDKTPCRARSTGRSNLRTAVVDFCAADWLVFTPPLTRMAVEFSDLVGQTPEPMRLPPPSAAAISRMDTTMPWLTWLEAEDAKLVWARAEGARWKQICWRFGLTRATANRRWNYCLSVIAWRLNRRPIPAKWSRRFLVDRVKFVSSDL